MVHYVLEVVWQIVLGIIYHPIYYALPFIFIGPSEPRSVVIQRIPQLPRCEVRPCIAEVGLALVVIRPSLLRKRPRIKGQDNHIELMSRTRCVLLNGRGDVVRDSIEHAWDKSVAISEVLQLGPSHSGLVLAHLLLQHLTLSALGVGDMHRSVLIHLEGGFSLLVALSRTHLEQGLARGVGFIVSAYNGLIFRARGKTATLHKGPLVIRSALCSPDMREVRVCTCLVLYALDVRSPTARLVIVALRVGAVLRRLVAVS